MATIELDDGRSIDIRVPMFISEKTAIVGLQERRDTTRHLDWFNELADIIRPAVRSTSWAGDITDTSEMQLLMVVVRWQTVTEDDVLPLPTGSSLPTPSRKRGGRSRTSVPNP